MSYKKLETLRFLTYAQASCDETIDHLETLWETESLANRPLYNELHERANRLGKKLNRFIQSVESPHRSVKEENAPYDLNPAE